MRTAIALPTLVLALACSSEPPPEQDGKESIGTPSHAETGARAPAAEDEAKSMEAVVPATVVYGVKIPTGMHPAMGPDKVYRFEGAQLVPQVVAHIEEQVTRKQKLREIGGWLLRFARPKSGDASLGDGQLAIRIFERNQPQTGSVLDIWLEKEYAKDLPNRAAETSSYTFTALKRNVVRGGIPDEVREKRAKKLQETLRIMKKFEMGEPMTEEELKSDVFH